MRLFELTDGKSSVVPDKKYRRTKANLPNPASFPDKEDPVFPTGSPPAGMGKSPNNLRNSGGR